MEVLQDGVLETELWYDFLNLGFGLIPTAGSDFPYLSAPGGERNYVLVGDNYTVNAFFDALAKQRTFVSNGPLIEFTVNGQQMGSEIKLTAGDLIEIRASASLNGQSGHSTFTTFFGSGSGGMIGPEIPTLPGPVDASGMSS